MIKNFVVILIVALLTSCAQKNTEQKTAIERSSIVIDVRSPEEFQSGNLENSINIPYTIITEEITNHAIDKDSNIVVYCRSGRRSGIAQKALIEIGYKNTINAGAYEELKALETKQKE